MTVPNRAKPDGLVPKPGFIVFIYYDSNSDPVGCLAPSSSSWQQFNCSTIVGMKVHMIHIEHQLSEKFPTAKKWIIKQNKNALETKETIVNYLTETSL